MNSDVIALSHRFAQLMAEYSQSIEDGIITLNESKRLITETQAIQEVLLNMKLNLEEEAVSGDLGISKIYPLNEPIGADNCNSK